MEKMILMCSRESVSPVFTSLGGKESFWEEADQSRAHTPKNRLCWSEWPVGKEWETLRCIKDEAEAKTEASKNTLIIGQNILQLFDCWKKEYYGDRPTPAKIFQQQLREQLRGEFVPIFKSM